MLSPLLWLLLFDLLPGWMAQEHQEWIKTRPHTCGIALLCADDIAFAVSSPYPHFDPFLAFRQAEALQPFLRQLGHTLSNVDLPLRSLVWGRAVAPPVATPL